MANTMTLISSYTVGSGGSTNIDFTSIPSTYTDLVLKYSLRGTTENTFYVYVTFNNSSSNLSSKNVNGNASVNSSGLSYNYSSTFQDIAGQDVYVWTSSTFSNGEMYIPNYAGSSYKSISMDSVTENNATSAYNSLTAGLWSSVSAINRITLRSGTTDTFAQFSTAYLYGVKNA